MVYRKPFSILTFLSFLVLLLLITPLLVKGDCTCDSEAEDRGRDKTTATKYKFIAFAVIIIAGALGVSAPILCKKVPTLSPGENLFFMVKSFAGVILATGAVHIAPDAFESLTSPCLNEKPWGVFPFAGLIIGISIMGTMMIEVLANSYYKRTAPEPAREEDLEVSDHNNRKHAHSHTSVSLAKDSTSHDLLRQRVIAQALELGILVHSVIIGIDMGVSQSPATIKPLMVAITFHQMFEGMGLGGCIAQADFETRVAMFMVFFFAFTTPVGILIGFGITKVYSETSSTALIVEGVLNAAAAGVLLYMSLVDVLAVDFMNVKLQSNLGLLFGAGVSMILGFTCMSVLAIWA